MPEREEVQVGPLRLVAERSDLEPAVRPRVMVCGNVADDPPRWEFIDMAGDDWEELKQLAAGIVNFVPFTMLLTTLLDQGKLTVDDLREVAGKIPPGTLHFRPLDRDTHAEARFIVGHLLGLSD
jgi:ADP-ribose pyrophosphatase YjhB (NUDIX family)